MKLIDYEKVAKLIEQRQTIVKAIKSCEINSEYAAESKWWGQISVHEDGSGVLVDLRKCEVLDTVLKSTSEILLNKLDNVDDSLSQLGVDVDVKCNPEEED